MSKNAKKSNKIMVIAWLLIMFFIFIMYQSDGDSYEDNNNNVVVERTQPVGKVNFENTTVLESSSTRSGEQIYLNKCQACHASGLLGSPQFGLAQAWAPLIARGIKDILATAISGVGSMPAKGGCSDCSDEEIRLAIQYMIDNSN